MFHLADLGDVGVTGDEAVEERDERERRVSDCEARPGGAEQIMMMS